MKIILLIVLGLAFVYLGLQIKKYYTNRNNFYISMLKFINILAGEISFLKSDLPSVIKSNNFGSDVDKVLNNYIHDNKIAVGYLSDGENKEVANFLDSIGKSDVNGELNNINYYRTSFEVKSAQCMQDVKVKSNMYFKLISLCGLVLCIIFI